jgi:hypothetical protein
LERVQVFSLYYKAVLHQFVAISRTVDPSGSHKWCGILALEAWVWLSAWPLCPHQLMSTRTKHLGGFCRVPRKVRYAVRYVKDVLQQMSQVVAAASPMGE